MSKDKSITMFWDRFYLQVRLQNPSTKPLVYQVLLAGRDAADFRLPMGDTVQVGLEMNERKGAND